MKTVVLHLTIFALFLGVLTCHAQDQRKNEVRQPAVAGTFYPSSAYELKNQLDQLFATVEDTEVNENINAIIVPHAGYVFSGEVAASAYAKLDPDKTYKRIFIIGTCHYVLLDGASIYNRGDYKTPLGNVQVDTELADKLIKGNSLIRYVANAHVKEHSIEVQLPFLQYRLKKPFKIVPIVVGAQSAETCSELAKALKPFFTPDNLFVISSDFSHYPAYNDAVKVDRATGLAISANSPDNFVETLASNGKKNIAGLSTSCCGWGAVLTLLDITSAQNDISVQHIKYMNSGDTKYGDKNSVVGYHSYLFTNEKESSAINFNLTTKDKQFLLELARNTIEQRLEGNSIPKVNEDELSENLKKNCGAFVTLNKNNQLRGCIGRFVATEPLYKVVQEMALASAFQDYRFTPVVKNELKNIDIEISVLTPLKRIYSSDEFQLGKQGIYMVMNGRSGTFLPQVAETTGWNKEEFLGHCAQDKAGIGWDGWKKADLYTYEALVFDKKHLNTHK